MTWMLIAAIAVAGTIATFTDWLFMGVLFHDRYRRYPEVWWPGIREKGDKQAIIWSSVLGYLTAAAVVALCFYAEADTIKSALTVSVLAWAAGPLVVVVTNGFWIKTDPMITVMHVIGHLVRMLIAGLAAALAMQWAG
jgi:Protein of unknown function (DUF1761)